MNSNKFLTGADYGKILIPEAYTNQSIKLFIPREDGTRVSHLEDVNGTDLMPILGITASTDLIPGIDIFKGVKGWLIKEITITAGSVWIATDEIPETY